MMAAEEARAQARGAVLGQIRAAIVRMPPEWAALIQTLVTLAEIE